MRWETELFIGQFVLLRDFTVPFIIQDCGSLTGQTATAEPDTANVKANVRETVIDLSWRN
jgi:hypothetical protein